MNKDIMQAHGYGGKNLNVLSVNQDVTKTLMNSAVANNAQYNPTDSLFYGANNGDDYRISTPILAWNMSGTLLKTFNVPASYVIAAATYTVYGGSLFAYVKGSYIYTIASVRDVSLNYKWVLAKYDLNFNLITAVVDNGAGSPVAKGIYSDGINVYTIFFYSSTSQLQLRKYDLNLSLVTSADIGVGYTPAFAAGGFAYVQEAGLYMLIKHSADNGSFWFLKVLKSSLALYAAYNTVSDVFYVTPSYQLEIKPLSNITWAGNVRLLNGDNGLLAVTTLPIAASTRAIVFGDYLYFKSATSDLYRIKLSNLPNVTSVNFRRYLQNVSLDATTLIAYVRFFAVIGNLLYFKGDSNLYRIDSLKPTKY